MLRRVLGSVAAPLLSFVIVAPTAAMAEGTYCTLEHPALVPLNQVVVFKQKCLDPATLFVVYAFDSTGTIVATQTNRTGTFSLGFTQEGNYRIVSRARFADGSETQAVAAVHAGTLIVTGTKPKIH